MSTPSSQSVFKVLQSSVETGESAEFMGFLFLRKFDLPVGRIRSRSANADLSLNDESEGSMAKRSLNVYEQ